MTKRCLIGRRIAWRATITQRPSIYCLYFLHVVQVMWCRWCMKALLTTIWVWISIGLISGYKKGELTAVNLPYHQSIEKWIYRKINLAQKYIAQALQGFIRMSFVLLYFCTFTQYCSGWTNLKKSRKKSHYSRIMAFL